MGSCGCRFPPCRRVRLPPRIARSPALAVPASADRLTRHAARVAKKFGCPPWFVGAGRACGRTGKGHDVWGSRGRKILWPGRTSGVPADVSCSCCGTPQHSRHCGQGASVRQGSQAHGHGLRRKVGPQGRIAAAEVLRHGAYLVKYGHKGGIPVPARHQMKVQMLPNAGARGLALVQADIEQVKCSFNIVAQTSQRSIISCASA